MDRVRRVLIDAFLFLTTLPAFAQIDLSGVWINNLHEDMQDRIFGPELGDYTGIPLNAAARARAEAWDASLLTLPEYQCRVHPSDYAPSFADIRIWEEIDKDTQSLAAVHLHTSPLPPSGRSGWMGALIPRITHCILRWDSLQGNGTATF